MSKNNAERLGRMGINIPEIMLPGEGVEWEKWAVIACDQFSSEKPYWEETRRIAGSAPSTLNIIIPECYLEDTDREQRGKNVQSAMKEYAAGNVLRTLEPGFIFIDRSTPEVPSRKGLVLAVDLEAYDFASASSSLIRPTEGTITSRLPPRMQVRREALLDLPHILILIDDPEDRVMRAAARAASEKLYDFSLMQEGGHIRGHFISEDALDDLTGAFEHLRSSSDLLFAVGDGNHSLATAREIWKEKKAAGALEDHPARFALVEVENIHDPGLLFHPIHRVLFNVNTELLKNRLKEKLNAHLSANSGTLARNEIRLADASGEEVWSIDVVEGRLAVEPLQAALDDLLAAEFKGAGIDYIHGDNSVRALVSENNKRMGIFLPELDKSRFFSRITDIGPYPRKTFSIGEAREKRYYLEARSLT